MTRTQPPILMRGGTIAVRSAWAVNRHWDLRAGGVSHARIAGTFR